MEISEEQWEELIKLVQGNRSRLDKLGEILTGHAVSLVSLAAPAKAKKQETGQIASDEELDGQYGDPAVWMEKMPKEWAGDNMKGVKLSECPADFLDCYAEALDRIGISKHEGGDAKYWRFHKDSARARGWAQRIRSGGESQW